VPFAGLPIGDLQITLDSMKTVQNDRSHDRRDFKGKKV
jgi:hypothetical protein